MLKKRPFFIFLLLVILTYTIFRISKLVLAEQQGSTPESGSSSRIKVIYDLVAASSYGSEASDSWGDWGAMWNRIYSSAVWSPSGDAAPGDVASGKTFYSTSRVLQTGQGSLQPTPAPVTPASGDNSHINVLYKSIATVSYGSESSGAWGDWGVMWNRIYSASIWNATLANAATSDVLAGKTFYSGSNRTKQTGTSLSNGSVCVNNSDCFTGICTTFYQDSDADNYGNASVSTKRCGSTYSGYVTNSTDCYDLNANAKPGQTSCYSVHRGDSSYDYNCSGTTTGCSPAIYSYTYMTNYYSGSSGDPDYFSLCWASGGYNVITSQVSCGGSGYQAGGSVTFWSGSTNPGVETWCHSQVTRNVISTAGNQTCI